MNKKVFVSENETKYKNARQSLLLVVILSVLNVFTIFFAETYFLFSSYFAQTLSIVGWDLYTTTGKSIYMIVFGGIALLSVVPYLLCWIFSKKRPGWMIAALVIFSVDSLLFLIDFVSYIAYGDYSMILDLVIRVIVIVSLALGVKYGFAKKEQPIIHQEATENDAPLTSDAPEITETRQITITRKKAFVGCAVQIICFVNGSEVCRLKNGETTTIAVPACQFELGANFTNGLAAGVVTVPAGSESVAYQLATKSGFVANTIEITPVK